MKQIMCTALGTIEVPSTTAVILYDKRKESLDICKVPMINLIGIGTDGASNMCGVNHSFFTLLQEWLTLSSAF